MDKKRFDLANGITAVIVLMISAFTYISTIEPTASFWDCGEFIASSYKMEVGHPPGNPVFQLFARFFTMFADSSHAAAAVNILSALCSAFTIMLLYLTIVFFAKRVFHYRDEKYSTAEAVAIIGSSVIGALAYCFSDSFWFSAVEGEVYAMSSLFTALVIWAMTKWYEQKNRDFAERWIILICFLMGLSVGVHLLNLLAIPTLVFLYYYKHNENRISYKKFMGIGLLSVAIIFVVLFVIIPYAPKLAGYADYVFVNWLGCPYNTGTAIFITALIAGGFAGAFYTYKKGKVLANGLILGLTSFMIGFSLFGIVIIRSNAMPPTNEYQPDNPFTLVRYLSREQYGSAPLLYGQYFDAPGELVNKKYIAPIGGKYESVEAPPEYKYSQEGKMLFPRMWSPAEQHINVYESYMEDSGTPVTGAEFPKPTFMTNMKFFFEYQVVWMYWRYFMWNFAGRQNDVHSPLPGNSYHGNWECGIDFIDHLRLGDQSDAPLPLKENKAKNHYYLLPLLLGLLGLLYQFFEDERGWWVCMLSFFMMGLAIVIYINQSPLQVRERDYSYAGSFYAFAIWIGFGALAVFRLLSKKLKGRKAVAVAVSSMIACASVPVIMAHENWNDHDRSNRRTAVEMAKNYLNSVGKNGILVTHGDNDTFPLWYAQEVEGTRTDVRICNTSLLGTDWYIGQMKWACNKSAPLKLSVDQRQYLYGTNEYVIIFDKRDTIIPLKDVMKVFRHPKAKVTLENGRSVDYIVSRKFSIPVNKENVIKYGILPEKYKDMIPDEIVLTIPAGKNYISKPELFFLDLLSNYEWDRPLHLLANGGDINIGLKEYLMYDGFSSHFVPIKNSISYSSIGLADTDHLYKMITETYKWDALKRDDYLIDYQNQYTFLGVNDQREIFLNCARAMMKENKTKEALKLLDMAVDVMPQRIGFPLESLCLGLYNNDITVISIIEAYLKAGEPDKALKLGKEFSDELMTTLKFYIARQDAERAEQCVNLLYYLEKILTDNNQKDFAATISSNLDKVLKV